MADEHAFVGRELTSLCIGEYKSFVAVHQCKEQVKGALDEFDASLEELRRAIPELERECATFVEETSGIQSARRRAQLVLEHQDKLEDLLDIPQLVDTCVRSGYYHEAMELTSHTRQLVSHYPGVPLVHSISAQVDSIMQLQLSQLVASLREPVKLPVLVKSIGFLRKMGSLEEDELRLAFLESRAQRWRDHVKEHVDKERSEPTRYVRRYVDAFRELQYDTVVQYTAIFLDPTPFRSQPNRKGKNESAGMDEASRVQALDLIVRYAHHAVSDLLHCITSKVPSISDPSSLASLLTQLGYTALSFSRVGMDFSAYLPEVFENAVLGLTITGWEKGLNAALDRLRPTSTSQKSASPSGRSDLEAVFVPGFLVSPEILQTLTHSEPPQFAPPIHSPPESKIIPPLYLSSFPLLAAYTNATLTTLNSLRLLAPVALFPRLYSHLLGNLADLGQALLDYANRSTGQADPGRGPVPRKRPEGLRRNTSISNRDQLAERTEARERHGRRILSAILDAYVHGCAEFLKMALVEGVYDGQFGNVDRLRLEAAGDVETKTDQFAAVSDRLKEWVARHAEKTASKDTQDSKVIKEEETSAADNTVTGGSTDIVENESVRGAGTVPSIPLVVPIEPEDPVVGFDVGPPETEETGQHANGAKAPVEVPIDSTPLLEEKARGPDPKDSPLQQSLQNPIQDNEASLLESPTPNESSQTDNAARISAGPNSATEHTPELDVIERVLEIQLEKPEAIVPEELPSQSMTELSIAENPNPGQVTEDVQLPVSVSASSDIDNAVPVAVVADSSDGSQVQEKGVHSTKGDKREVDELDQLIAAKQAVDNASYSKSGSTEQIEVRNEDATTTEIPITSNIPSPAPAVASGMPAPSLPDLPLDKRQPASDVDTAADAVRPDDVRIAEFGAQQREEYLPPHDAEGPILAESATSPQIENTTSINIAPASETSDTVRPSSPAETQEAQLSNGGDSSSGAATPANEAEAEAEAKGTQPDATPATVDVANTNNAKSKKKKNKKKGKK